MPSFDTSKATDSIPGHVAVHDVPFRQETAAPYEIGVIAKTLVGNKEAVVLFGPHPAKRSVVPSIVTIGPLHLRPQCLFRFTNSILTVAHFPDHSNDNYRQALLMGSPDVRG